MFPNRWNDGGGRGGDKSGDGVRWPGKGVEASGAAGEPEGVDRVAKIKNWGVCERFSEGTNEKNEKYCSKVVGSVERKISAGWLGLPSGDKYCS